MLKVGLVSGDRPAAFRQRDEPLDGVAERLPGRPDAPGSPPASADTSLIVTSSWAIVRLHELAPCDLERPEGREPRRPIGRLAEGRGRLAEPLPKGASEPVRRFVAGIDRYFRDALSVLRGQLARSALHTGELDIAVHGQFEGRRELAMEMEFREGGDPAHRLQVQSPRPDAGRYSRAPAASGHDSFEAPPSSSVPSWRHLATVNGHNLPDRCCGLRDPVEKSLPQLSTSSALRSGIANIRGDFHGRSSRDLADRRAAWACGRYPGQRRGRL